jgi:hypothetical protein
MLDWPFRDSILGIDLAVTMDDRQPRVQVMGEHSETHSADVFNALLYSWDPGAGKAQARGRWSAKPRGRDKNSKKKKV